MTLLRHDANPVITRTDLPDVPPDLIDATSVFNPGAVWFRGEILLLLRVQTRGRRTHLMTARSADGVGFRVDPRLVEIEGLYRAGETIYHVYDPRITRIGDHYLVLTAMDTDGACRIGAFRTDDFETLEFLGSEPHLDVRNGVLFPERFHGKYLRLDRPNRKAAPGEPWSGATVMLSESDDLVTWSPIGPVFSGRPHYWDELVGPGPPPIRTEAGWLCLYHGIATHFMSANIYQAGAVLLDLDDPSKVVGRTRDNILEPRESFELTGQVPNVVFPSGMVRAPGDDGRVLVYYGAADTAVGLATATVTDLIRACDTSVPDSFFPF